MKQGRLLVLAAILILAAAVRLYRLGDVPMGVTNDEIGYIYNAYSISHTGNNIYGQKLPLFTYVYKRDFPFMPVPTYILAAFFRIFPLNTFNGRLPTALLGTATVYLVFLFCCRLFKKTSVPYAAAFSLAVSPWHIFFSRSAYDTVWAAFFYLASLTALVTIRPHRPALSVSVGCFLMGLFSYRGMVPMAPFLAIIFIWYLKAQRIVNSGTVRIFMIGTLACLVLYGFIAYSERGNGFVSEATPDIRNIEQQIELSSRESRGPQIVKRIFLNKPVFLTDKYLNQYLSAYSPGILFLHGEQSQLYSMWNHGKFYILDIILVGLGIYFLIRTRQPAASFIGLTVLAAGVPGMIGGEPYGARNLFMTIPAAIIAGCGVYFITAAGRMRHLFIIMLVLLYLFSFSRFNFDYFGRYAFDRSETWFKSMKDLSLVVRAGRKKHSSVLIRGSMFPDFLQYAFYTRIAPVTVQHIAGSADAKSGTFGYDNVGFSPDCLPSPTGIPANRPRELLIMRSSCKSEATPSGRISDFYGNPVWNIYDF